MNGSPDNQENRFVKFLGSRNSITVSGKLYGIGDEDRDALPFSFPESFLVNGKTDCRVVDLFPRFFVVDHRFDSDFENIYADLLRNMERFGAAGEPPFQEHRKNRNAGSYDCPAEPRKCFWFESQRAKNEFDTHEFFSDHAGCFLVLVLILILLGTIGPFLIK